MKPMALNTILYKYGNEKKEEELKYESVNDYRYDDPLKSIDEQPVEAIVNEQLIVNEVQDPCHIQWQIFDEILERVYIIEYDGYADKKGNPLDNEESIKHLISCEPPVNIDTKLEFYDENGEIDYIDYVDYDDYLSRDHKTYDLRKITKQIRTKKFICEASIGSGKSTAIRK